MAECSKAADAFKLAARGETPMNVVAVIQHTAGEYLGLMEDHLEGRRIRFQYFRPFAGGRKLPAPDLPADALILLGHLFLGQPNALPAPGTSICGVDPDTVQPEIPPIPEQAAITLGCDKYPGDAFPEAACP